MVESLNGRPPHRSYSSLHIHVEVGEEELRESTVCHLHVVASVQPDQRSSENDKHMNIQLL